MDLVHRKYFNEIRRKSYKIVFVLIRQSQQDNALLKSDKSSLLEILPNQGFDKKKIQFVNQSLGLEDWNYFFSNFLINIWINTQTFPKYIQKIALNIVAQVVSAESIYKHQHVLRTETLFKFVYLKT